MADHSFLILSGDTIVAKWEHNTLFVVNDCLLPLYLKYTPNAELWIETRAIDSHRPNSRLLKKALRLKKYDDISTVIHVNAATITDNYWIKPLDSNLTYEDIRFTDDLFSSLALKGSYASFNRAANCEQRHTPELTNIGSFEKCWKLIDGKWWMYKTANHDEIFSELFIYHLGKALNMNMAVYERGNKCVKSLDFTNNASVNFEPAFTIMGDNEDYEDVFAQLMVLCPQAAIDFAKMIFLDTVTVNPDRHTANFGLLRDTGNGNIIGLAPLFDHNMALIARGYPKHPTKKDILIRLFNDFMDNHSVLKQHLPVITKELLQSVLHTVNMKVRSKEIVSLIMKRYDLIRK